MSKDHPIDLTGLRNNLENACEQAIWIFRRNPSERTFAVSYGKLDGIFQGTIMALRAAEVDLIRSLEIEIVRDITLKFQATLTRERS